MDKVKIIQTVKWVLLHQVEVLHMMEHHTFIINKIIMDFIIFCLLYKRIIILYLHNLNLVFSFNLELI
jgi:hypothetical protein